jgi:hypothetical protein
VKKIPTVFERDWDGDRSRVLDVVVPGCEWVLAGEGVPTRKYDGTACLIRSGYLWKRHEVKPGKTPPVAFIREDYDEQTGKTIGWVPVTDGPDDRWHREAFDNLRGNYRIDATYELVGPKVQGNSEGFSEHCLIRHELAEVLADAPRAFDDFEAYFASHDVEGIVWHHPDGRMAKLKARDFGIRRTANHARTEAL